MDKVIGNFSGQADKSFPLDCGTLEALQTNTLLVELLGNIAGDKIILSGCELNAEGTERKEGYVFLRTRDYPMGEILRWAGGSVFSGMKIVTEDVQVVTEGNVYSKAYNRRYLEAGSGGEHYEWEDFQEPHKNTLFKVEQLLTEDEQAQVRENIGAVSAKVVEALKSELGGIRGYAEVLYSLISKLFKDKQEKLVDGETIKTINGHSLLGSGDIALPTGDGSTPIDLNGYLTRSSAAMEYTKKTDVAFYDVDRYNPTGDVAVFHTPTSARNVVPQDARRKGLTITYKTAEGVHVVERFVGSGNLDLTTERDWGNNNYWLREFPYVINAHDFKALADGEYFENLDDAIKWVPECHRRPGVIFTCQTKNGEWLLKRFIGTGNSEWFATGGKWVDVDTVRRSVSVVVAAFDSTDEEKRCADIVATSETGGYSAIRLAIGRLGENGGVVQLMSGTYSAPVVEGESADALKSERVYMLTPNITLQGVGFGTRLTTQSDVATANIQLSAPGCIIRNLSLSLGVNDTNNSGVTYENVRVAGEVINMYALKDDVAKVIAVKPSAGIKGIQEAMKEIPDGGKIMLEAGTYSNTDGGGLFLNTPNVTIEGQGKATIISRTDSTNDVFVQDGYADTVKNVVLKDLAIEHGGTFVTPNYKGKPVKFINCWIGGKYYHQNQESCNNIITVGRGMDYDTVFKAYESISSSTPLPSATNRYEIHVYGHIKEEAGKRLYLNKQYVDIIGHNAIIEYEDNNPINGSGLPCAVILDNAVTNPAVAQWYGDYNRSTYKNLHFLRTGTLDAYNFPCVELRSDYVTLINCTFENQTKAVTEFKLKDNGSGILSDEKVVDDYNGDRRHGLVIFCNNYDNACETRLINCVGIGSPNGYQNTRGIYISSGSPKLYNCIGYGGGKWKFSHGIICHRYSKPTLFNCVGYGSIYTDSRSSGGCCGIRFQSMTQAELHNCVGYAGSADNGAGFSVWHKSQPRLINCIGYGGKGKESVGLDVADQANPLVFGGYYGVANNAMGVTFEKNDGKRMKFVLSADADCVIKQCVTWLTTANMTQTNVPKGTTFSVRKADGTVIIDKSAVDYEMSAISYPEAAEVVINAGEELTMLWQDASGNEIEVADDTLKLQIQYQYAGEGGHGLRLLRNSKGVMRDVTFESNINGNGIDIDTVNNSSELDRCTIIGHGGVAINPKRGMLENVNIRNSSIKGDIVNVNSFKEMEPIGGNNCKI